MTDEKIFQLIRKLSRITQDNGATQNESLCAAEKIAALKNEYNIELEDLEINEFEAVGEEVDMKYVRIPLYLQSLISALADVFDCKVIKTNKSIYNIIGLPQDVTICKHFYKYLSRIFINEAKGRKNKNAFCEGMLVSIIKKLSPPTNNDKPTKEQKAVVINKSNAVEEYIKEKIGKVKNTTRYIKGNEDSYNDGMLKGESVSLSTPVECNGQIKISL